MGEFRKKATNYLYTMVTRYGPQSVASANWLNNRIRYLFPDSGIAETF